jgi:hypothetical protein
VALNKTPTSIVYVVSPDPPVAGTQLRVLDTTSCRPVNLPDDAFCKFADTFQYFNAVYAEDAPCYSSVVVKHPVPITLHTNPTTIRKPARTGAK